MNDSKLLLITHGHFLVAWLSQQRRNQQCNNTEHTSLFSTHKK